LNFTAFYKPINYLCVVTLFSILLTNFLLGTNNDSFDDDDNDGDGDGDDDDGDGDGDEHVSCIGRLRTYSDSHFATYVRENILTIFARF
jgi:hypothetical protein